MPFKTGDRVRAKRDITFPDGTKIPKGEEGTVTASTEPVTGITYVLFDSQAIGRPVHENDLEPLPPNPSD